MKYKISLAALVVAGAFSGQAMAGTNGDALQALVTANGGAPDTTFAQTWAGIAGQGSAHNVPWGDPSTTDNATICTWAGVWCDGSNDITHLELPNAGLTTASIAELLTALDSVKTQLQVLNFSNTTTPANDISGDLSGLAGFTALTHLALNNAGADGAFPDMSAATNLNWISIADSPGITSMSGKLAGGSAITHLQANNNLDMTGDMTETFANIAHPINSTLHGTKLYGTLNWTTGDVVSVQDSAESKISDVVVIGGTVGDHGYDATVVVQPVASSSITATPGEQSATVNWTAPTDGVQTGYSVSLTADEGETLVGTAAIADAATVTHSFSGITAGTYKAVVQSTGPDSRMSAPILSDANFVITAPVTPPESPTCTGDQVLNEAGDECVDPEETTKKSGGGAALWLALVPLMGLFRRKRAA